VDRVPDPGKASPLRYAVEQALDDLRQGGVVEGGGPPDPILEEAGGVLGDAQDDAADAQQAGGDGALQRFGGAGVGQPGRQGVGRDAMVGDRHQDGVEHG
jgi:hypothetical protein